MIKLFLKLFLLTFLLNPIQALGAVQFLTGYELGASVDAYATSGTFSYQTSVVRTGTYALRSNPTGTAVGLVRHGTLSAAGVHSGAGALKDVYISFYFRVDTLPASASEEILEVTATGGTSLQGAVRITSAGKLQLYDSANAQAGSDSTTALSTATWYQIDVRIQSSNTGTGEVKINGTSEISTTADFKNASSDHGGVSIGKVVNRNGNSVDFYYDDFVSSNTAYVGSHKIKVLIPTGVGDVNDWGGNAADVDDIPDDTATTDSSSAADQRQTYDVTDSSTAGVSGTINAVMLYSKIREATSGASLISCTIRSGTTNSDTTAADKTGYTNTFKLLETDPNTASAWTTTSIDAVEIGAYEDASSPVRTQLADNSLQVSFTESTSSTATQGNAKIKYLGGKLRLLSGRLRIF